jgi:hypothetical protein
LAAASTRRLHHRYDFGRGFANSVPTTTVASSYCSRELALRYFSRPTSTALLVVTKGMLPYRGLFNWYQYKYCLQLYLIRDSGVGSTWYCTLYMNSKMSSEFLAPYDALPSTSVCSSRTMFAMYGGHRCLTGRGVGDTSRRKGHSVHFVFLYSSTTVHTNYS